MLRGNCSWVPRPCPALQASACTRACDTDQQCAAHMHSLERSALEPVWHLPYHDNTIRSRCGWRSRWLVPKSCGSLQGQEPATSTCAHPRTSRAVTASGMLKPALWRRQARAKPAGLRASSDATSFVAMSCRGRSEGCVGQLTRLARPELHTWCACSTQCHCSVGFVLLSGRQATCSNGPVCGVSAAAQVPCVQADS